MIEFIQKNTNKLENNIAEEEIHFHKDNNSGTSSVSH